ncbi:MAG: Tnp 1 protein [Candidatus Brocadiaceae bacterium]|nr:Tnp 1 protein [Candidatus Brocadiaceae bacterium]MBM2833052.1 Tnp 1 protein [Candidatus Brocadiaceae bacterium]
MFSVYLIYISIDSIAGFGIENELALLSGNIHDSKTFQDVITSFGQYDFKPGGLCVYDRGITSGRNILDIKALQWDTLCGVAFNAKIEKLWHDILAGGNLEQYDNHVRLKDSVFYVVTEHYEIGGVSGELALCFNAQQQRRLRESRYEEIRAAQVLLQNKKPIKEGLGKFFDKQGSLIKSKLREAEEFDGCSCIFCTRNMPKEEILRLYFDKDIVEKAFHSIKGITNLQPIRHWLSNRVKAHVFVCYLSYLLLSLLKYRLGKIEISAEDALRELMTMYKVYLRDTKNVFKLSRVVTLTKKQELILKTLDKKLLKL